MKKIVSLLLILVLLMPVLALAEFPLTTQEVTFTVFGQRDQNTAEWKDIYVLNEYEKMTGIHMEWQEIPSQGFDENKALLFSSNELPDLFIRSFLSPDEVLNYGVNSQQLIPLNDLIEQYAPNFSALMEKYPIIRQALTASDGNIYTMPALDISDTGLTSYKQWINKDWLAALNLEMPTTTEELKQVLIAFRDGDPNGNGIADEIPLGFREPSTVYEFGGSFGLQHNLQDTYNVNEDGTIHNWLCDDEFKAYLTYLNDLYNEKLLWQEYYLNDRPMWRSNLANAYFGVFGMPYSDVFINVEDQFTALAPVDGPNGDHLWSAATSVVNTSGSFAISYTCEHPELAVQWVDYFYSPEGSLFYRYGVEGVTYYLDENNTPQINDEIKNAPEGFMTALGKINLVPGGAFPCLIDNQTDAIVASALTKEVAAVFVPYLPETVLRKPTLSIEAADRAVAIEQDLNTYRDTSVTKFILGEWSIEEKWGEYVQTLEKLGIRELEALYQEALNQ